LYRAAEAFTRLVQRLVERVPVWLTQDQKVYVANWPGSGYAVKVVVAHNRYRSAQPWGENRIVDAEIEQLAGAGVEVIPFLRSSDDIPALPPSSKPMLTGSCGRDPGQLESWS
jgi:hypothetical protein